MLIWETSTSKQEWKPQFILGECVRGEGQGPQKEPAREVGLSSPEHIPESKKKASLLGRDGAWVLGFTP